MSDLRYPIGPYERPEPLTDEHVRGWIRDIETLPKELRKVVEPLSPVQLDTPYRPDGWTVRQVVGHLADSHMNSIIRLKLALTEDRPTIKPYFEDRWSLLPDSAGVPVPATLDLLDGLHYRWVVLLRGLTWQQLQRDFLHPDSGITPLSVNTGMYAWHGKHHLAHITRLIEREGWR